MSKKKDKKNNEDSLVDNLGINFENITGNDIEDLDTEPEFDEFFSGLAKDLEGVTDIEEPDHGDGLDSGEESVDADNEDGSDDEPNDDKKDASDPELEKMKQYKDFLPLLDVMMNDPQLVSIVKNYLTGEDTASATEGDTGFEIPEDFIFDFEEAVSNPESDSGKLLDKYVRGRVESTLNAELSKEKQQAALEEQKRRVMKKFGVGEADVNDLIDWSMNTQLTLEDAFYLKNRSKIEKEIAKNAINSALRKKSNNSKSFGSKGKPGGKSEPEDELFKLIKGSIEFGGGALG